MSHTEQFNIGGFGWRLLAALILVFFTFNPSGWSFFHWATHDPQNQIVGKIFVGVVLLIGWVIFIRATANSLGGVGLMLAAAFFGTLIWLLVDWGVLPAGSADAVLYLAEFALAGILAVGMSWSHIRRRLSGQVDTDEIEG
ncbi:MAG: hypothetical protein JXA04_00505 [Gammaproteobacteria bacterium]|nr:hypothetical protein [Gammaproteobacteria bacterium]